VETVVASAGYGSIVDPRQAVVVTPRFDGTLDPTFARALVLRATDDPPQIVEVATKKALATLRTDKALAFSCLELAGRSAISCRGRALLGIDLASGRLVRPLTWGDPHALSPDGRADAHVHAQRITVEDFASGVAVGPAISVPELSPSPGSVTWSPRGKYLTALVERGKAVSLVVYNARTGARVTALGLTSASDRFRWSPDETGISVVPSGKEDGEVCHVFDVPGGRERFKVTGQKRWDMGLWSSDGARLVFDTEPSLSPFVVDARTGARLATLGGRPLSGWAPRDRRLAVKLPGGGACVWDEPSKACGAMLALSRSSATADARLRWTPSGTKLAADPSGREVELYDAATGALVGARAHPPAGGHPVEWYDDDHIVVQLAELWLIRISDGATVRAAASPTGAGLLLVGTDGEFAGDPAARERLLFRKGRDIVRAPLVSAREDRLRPDLWASALAPPPPPVK
jgi:hypothetical protein